MLKHWKTDISEYISNLFQRNGASCIKEDSSKVMHIHTYFDLKTLQDIVLGFARPRMYHFFKSRK